jgi:hypothetical protein
MRAVEAHSVVSKVKVVRGDHDDIQRRDHAAPRARRLAPVLDVIQLPPPPHRKHRLRHLAECADPNAYENEIMADEKLT